MNGQVNGRAPMFLLEGVGKAYPRSVALAPLSMRIDAGEKVAVLGPSGSGKTTLLHLLGGVIQPDHGVITIDDRPLAHLGPGRELAGLVGVMHQQFDLVPHLAVVHNVLAGNLGRWGTLRSLLSLVSPRERHVALDALDRLGIGDKLYERTSTLSGGEQQRVAMARLLVQTPKAILADEPVASLDPARAEDLTKLLAEVAADSGRTLVASLHSVDLTRRYFDRAIGLRNGQVQFDSPVEDVTDDVLERLYDIEGLDSAQ